MSQDRRRMQTSVAGVNLIARHEGKRLEAYRDPVGVWTIGCGHTKNVKEGDTITDEQCRRFLMDDLQDVELCINNRVKVPLTQSQFDALASFTFNLGCGALTRSTLLGKLNDGLYADAAQEFDRWVNGHVQGRLTVLPGLIKRRREEREWFESGQHKLDAAEPAPDTSAEAHEAPASSAAPVEDRSTTATIEERKSMPAPFIAAAIPTLIQYIPDLVRWFGKDGDVTERNAKIAGAIVDVAIASTGALNAQDAVHRMSEDPAAAERVRTSVRNRWYDLEEVAGGITAAREANAHLAPLPRLGVRFHELLTLLVVTGAYGIGALYLFTGSPAPEMAAALVTALVISALGGIVAYWFGSTSGSAVKSELLARKN